MCFLFVGLSQVTEYSSGDIEHFAVMLLIWNLVGVTIIISS